MFTPGALKYCTFFWNSLSISTAVSKTIASYTNGFEFDTRYFGLLESFIVKKLLVKTTVNVPTL